MEVVGRTRQTSSDSNTKLERKVLDCLAIYPSCPWSFGKKFVYYEEIERELNRILYMSVGVMKD